MPTAAVEHLYYDLGQQKRGAVAEVHLKGNAANVMLMNRSNYSNYKAGRRCNYYGGQAKRSPVHLPIPSSGHWYVVVDLGGYPGKVNAAVNVLPGPLPPLRPVDPGLATIAENLADALPVEPEDKDYDVFVSHASEDKDSFVRPLAHALRDQGLSVWYDEFELRVGSNLRQSIDAGLANSRFGVVVLSRAFLAKKSWSAYELDGLVTREMDANGEQIILPIWHEISKSELIKHSPSLANKVALKSSDETIEEIAAKIAAVINAED
jgi:Domain of unknown function (DUF1883)/TIR domain